LGLTMNNSIGNALCVNCWVSLISLYVLFLVRYILFVGSFCYVYQYTANGVATVNDVNIDDINPLCERCRQRINLTT
jgi:hypothetical protein